jgi:hypothetical protein
MIFEGNGGRKLFFFVQGVAGEGFWVIGGLIKERFFDYFGYVFWMLILEAKSIESNDQIDIFDMIDGRKSFVLFIKNPHLH